MPDDAKTKKKPVTFMLSTDLIEKIDDEAHFRGIRWPARLVEDQLRTTFGMPLIHAQNPGQSA